MRNNLQNDSALNQPLKRFFHLVHGETARTPTKAEYAMYAAFSAGLRSACLSRQVGAAITDAQGNVLSTGCNDVPKGGGGLYSEDDQPSDHRCIHLEGGICFNHRHKDRLGEEIRDLMIQRGIGSSTATELAADIRSRTALRDLLEFSRSVHAEMDALISIARKGGPSVVGGSLYTTTFPCHNCARHIVAAGLAKVFYIEPYEKSLALTLHRDAIASDSEDPVGKVQFLHFEGVAPRQYQELFLAKNERKTGTQAVRSNMSAASKTRAEYLDSLS